MPTFSLNGQSIPFEQGDTIMRAAWRAGIEIPHYCWHPGLSVAANCRMCLVHVQSGRQGAMPIMKWDAGKKAYVPDTKPKLWPACQMTAAPGMEVSSESEDVKKAQASVQEFLLLNHPVDCPICDQAGECKLQDYYLEHQATSKRKLTEPVHKPKGVRFGPTIVYDAERCIMCTRCIRVCDELVGDHVLDMRERGNRNEIILAPGRQLDHDYTLMTEHVCPVGALTSKDFRFKARVWFLKAAKGVCNGCATGCNTHVDYDPRSSQVFRLRPRDNMEVNKFWMCDDGMMTYKSAHDERIKMASLGRGAEAMPSMAEDAIAETARRLHAHGDKIAFVLSAGQSTEDNYALAKLANAVGGKLYLTAKSSDGWKADDILRHADPNPNRAGAIKAAGGAIEDDIGDLISDVLGGAIKAIVSLGHVCGEDDRALQALESVETHLALASNTGALTRVASAVIPIASWAEAPGTYINAKGHTQSYKRAIPAPTGVMPGWQVISRLAQALGHHLGFDQVMQVREEALAAPPSAATSAPAE